MSPDLKPGHRFQWSYTVPARATVPELYHDTAFCRDMPAVLATGYMVGMMELACVHGMMPFMDWPREQSVGVMVAFEHLAPTPPGMDLRIEGEVLAVEGRRVRFRVEAWDACDRICVGTHERMVIDPLKFNARVAAKGSAA
ncbi:thioesterase family protein [Massilia sp. TS11]|uniref:thioesterase family protein n=1 Tax=Massilia sp. TS11 TaxID=2908003 RepID=UPI001EDA59D8|nr:thioesterase family protein [Massilia sp. TS11]MCG2585266.1 thioesterase family protein [Massilia sp. TS11]